MVMFTVSSQTSSTNVMSKGQAKVSAQSIIEQARAIQSATAMLISRGCSESELSFDNSFDSGYTNNARADGSCRIFGPGGAGLNYIVPDSASLDASKASNAPSYHGKWYFYNRVCVDGVGTGVSPCWDNGTLADNDLVVYLAFLKKEVCAQINVAAGIPLRADGQIPISGGTSITFSGSVGKFIGKFQTESSNASSWIGSQGPDGYRFRRKEFGCNQLETAINNGVPSGNYVFYMVLLAR